MKATDLIRKENDIKDLYEEIQKANNRGEYKSFIPHNVYVSQETINDLIRNGFKTYYGEWDGIMKNCLIIEW